MTRLRNVAGKAEARDDGAGRRPHRRNGQRDVPTLVVARHANSINASTLLAGIDSFQDGFAARHCRSAGTMILTCRPMIPAAIAIEPFAAAISGR